MKDLKKDACCNKTTYTVTCMNGNTQNLGDFDPPPPKKKREGWNGCLLRAHSIGLIQITMTHPFSGIVFASAQLNPDESSDLIRLIQKKLRLSSDELDAHLHS